MLRSFAPRGGVISRVTVYPSDFGLTRLQEEARLPPASSSPCPPPTLPAYVGWLVRGLQPAGHLSACARRCMLWPRRSGTDRELPLSSRKTTKTTRKTIGAPAPLSSLACRSCRLAQRTEQGSACRRRRGHSEKAVDQEKLRAYERDRLRHALPLCLAALPHGVLSARRLRSRGAEGVQVLLRHRGVRQPGDSGSNLPGLRRHGAPPTAFRLPSRPRLHTAPAAAPC